MRTMRPFGFLKAALMYALVAMTLVVWMPSAKAQQPDGSAEHPFLIQNADQLRAFRDCVNSGGNYYYDLDNVTFQISPRPAHYVEIHATEITMHFKLMSDINLNNGLNVAACDGDGSGART